MGRISENRNLPDKVRNNFLHKFKNFFANLFRKEEKKNDGGDNTEIHPSMTSIDEKQEQFVTEDTKSKDNVVENTLDISDIPFAEYRKEMNDKKAKEDIIKLIDKNPNVLYQLSNERIEQLILLYEEEINKLDIQIIQKKKRLGIE